MGAGLGGCEWDMGMRHGPCKESWLVLEGKWDIGNTARAMQAVMAATKTKSLGYCRDGTTGNDSDVGISERASD